MFPPSLPLSHLLVESDTRNITNHRTDYVTADTSRIVHVHPEHSYHRTDYVTANANRIVHPEYSYRRSNYVTADTQNIAIAELTM